MCKTHNEQIMEDSGLTCDSYKGNVKVKLSCAF
jgi:hypothetical protein